MAIENSRRQKIKEEKGLITQEELATIEKSVSQEEMRAQKKINKQRELESSFSYGCVKTLKTVLDDYYIDPIVGFIFPGAGDILTSVCGLPFVYVSLFKVRSIPLTLAVVYNILMDALIGLIPFYIGNILDIFKRSYKKNYRLIVGFVEDDQSTIKEVNQKSIFMAIMIGVLIYLIYLMIQLVNYLINIMSNWFDSISNWFSNLF